MFKALVFTRGEVRVINVMFELNVPYAIMDDSSRIPLDAKYLHHIEQVKPHLWYQFEVLPP